MADANDDLRCENPESENIFIKTTLYLLLELKKKKRFVYSRIGCQHFLCYSIYGQPHRK